MSDIFKDIPLTRTQGLIKGELIAKTAEVLLLPLAAITDFTKALDEAYMNLDVLLARIHEQRATQYTNLSILDSNKRKIAITYTRSCYIPMTENKECHFLLNIPGDGCFHELKFDRLIYVDDTRHYKQEGEQSRELIDASYHLFYLQGDDKVHQYTVKFEKDR